MSKQLPGPPEHSARNRCECWHPDAVDAVRGRQKGTPLENTEPISKDMWITELPAMLCMAGMPRVLAMSFTQILWRLGESFDHPFSVQEYADKMGLNRGNVANRVVKPLIEAGLLIQRTRYRGRANYFDVPAYTELIKRTKSYFSRSCSKSGTVVLKVSRTKDLA